MSYKLVVFDFDGTLADSFPFFLEVFDTLADIHGFKRLDRSRLDQLRRCDARELIRHVDMPLWKMPRVAMHFKALMADNIGRIALFDGAGEMLQRLAERGTQLAILSSNSEENVRAVLGPEHASLIHHYVCGVSLFGKHRKLRRLLADSGFARHEVLCVGDEIRDIEAARAERLAFGAVGWGYTRIEALRAHAPELVFASVDEIAEQVAGRHTGQN
ncbi:HAD hydrolase-like protein [Noviherbaspirillum massiliense]|uniref:HAD hydrolase-like protein n=1 Tax=Noviherbaspirillum massiliense TaxID=1465823 RepID=UPI0002F80765|nr:HAD hydrolase-like protein [Noviherbaspirillum massiliense]